MNEDRDISFVSSLSQDTIFQAHRLRSSSASTAAKVSTIVAAKISAPSGPTAIALTLLIPLVLACLFAQLIADKSACRSSYTTGCPGVHARSLVIAWGIVVWWVWLVIGLLVGYTHWR